MKVKIAESAGFCFGVKRAVESVYKEIENNNEKKQIYTYTARDTIQSKY